MSDPEPFTYEYYRSMLGLLKEMGYRFVGYCDRDAILGDDNCVILRHDIDITPQCIYGLSQIEREFQVNSSYFFLVSSPLYNPFDKWVVNLVKDLRGAGDEVGLHFNFLDRPTGPEHSGLPEAVNIAHLEFERAYGFPADIMGYHSPPSLAVNDIPVNYPHNFDRFYSHNLYYMGDSRCIIKEDFLEVIRSGEYPKLQILTHPVWWSESRNSSLISVRRALSLVNAHIDYWLDENFKIYRGVK